MHVFLFKNPQDASAETQVFGPYPNTASLKIDLDRITPVFGADSVKTYKLGPYQNMARESNYFGGLGIDFSDLKAKYAKLRQSKKNAAVRAAEEIAVTVPVTARSSKSVSKGVALLTQLAHAKALTRTTPVTYNDYIFTAITALAERGGSSYQAIRKYILGSFKFDHEDEIVSRYIRNALKRNILTGKLIKVKNSYKINTAAVVSAEKKKKAARKTAAQNSKAKKAAAAMTAAHEDNEDEASLEEGEVVA